MIAYIQGKLLQRDADRVIVLTGGIGYEVLLPAIVVNALPSTDAEQTLSFHIFHYQTERQPKPVLIGFNTESEKEFFQHFISVVDIGPLKAVKALSIPVEEIAAAIESRNVALLKQLKGIGARTAQKIIATLEGKVSQFAVGAGKQTPGAAESNPMQSQVLDVLVQQLGHKPLEAKRMIAEALAHKPSISSPEALFEEIYRAEAAK